MTQTPTSIANWYTLHKLKPQFLAQLKNFAIFGDNGSEALLLTNDNRVFALGRNSNGILGVGHKQPLLEEPEEMSILSGKSVIGIYYGFKHVLALTEDGELYAWGDNSWGQLGVMNTFECLRPRLVGKQITAVACGANHTLALAQTGQVFAWGRNNYGQIGLGNNNNQMVPAKIVSLEPQFIKGIASGLNHSMALTDNGQVFAWGNNSFGQLGLGNCTHQTEAVQVKTLAEGVVVKAVVCGANHTLLLLANGELWSFGRNEYGQLGAPMVPLNEGSCIPIKVSAGANRFDSISAHFGMSFSAGISQSGYALVWGELASEEQPVREPRETPLTNFQEAYAIYSRRRNTPTTGNWLEDGLALAASGGHAFNRVMERLANSFNDKESSDLEFTIDGKSIYVHRWFLRISSRYFERMLSNDWCDEQKNCIEVVHYKFTIYYTYLKYLYTDFIEVDLEEAIDLLDLAVCHLENDLKGKCVNILKANLTIDNCCRLYELAQRYELYEFERILITFVLNNVFEVCRSQGFRDMHSEYCKELLIQVAGVA